MISANITIVGLYNEHILLGITDEHKLVGIIYLVREH